MAAQRTAADAGTLWVATNLGRVFVSHNADNAIPANVTFARVDSTNAAAPERFVSAIAVDPSNPNHAWVAYSGFNALTPTTPGHVFEVTWHPGTSSSQLDAARSRPGRPADQSSGARRQHRRSVRRHGFRRAGPARGQLTLAGGGRRTADRFDPVLADPGGPASVVCGHARPRRLGPDLAIDCPGR